MKASWRKSGDRKRRKGILVGKESESSMVVDSRGGELKGKTKLVNAHLGDLLQLIASDWLVNDNKLLPFFFLGFF